LAAIEIAGDDGLYGAARRKNLVSFVPSWFKIVLASPQAEIGRFDLRGIAPRLLQGPT
jgi:hypothetical protein